MRAQVAPCLMSSVAAMGITPYVVTAETVYLHLAEMAILREPIVVIPLGGDSPYLDGYPSWAEYLVCEGMPWTKSEQTMLDHLLSLLPNFATDGSNDKAYQALSSGAIRIAPFGVPIKFQGSDGRVQPALGLATHDKKKILLLRHLLMNDPLGMLSIAYHEALHIAAGADEIRAHSGQLDMCERARNWLIERNLQPEAARQQMVSLLEQREARLQHRLQELRR